MPDTTIDTMRDHHPVPPLPFTVEVGAGQPRSTGAPAAGTDAGAAPRDVCERAPRLMRPACTLNGWLGINPAPAGPRCHYPTLERAARAARAVMPVPARAAAGLKAVDTGATVAEVGHLALEVAEAAGAHLPDVAALAGPLSALGFLVKANVEQARANRDGDRAARAHAVAVGFAKVLAATMDAGAPHGVARRPELWPVPAGLTNRCDDDYRRGVRAALDLVAGLTPAQVATMRRELERATPNVTPRADEPAGRLLERRLAVALGGYAGRADLRF